MRVTGRGRDRSDRARLSARELTTGEMPAHCEEVYGAKVTKVTISRIKEKVAGEQAGWSSRPTDRYIRCCSLTRSSILVRDGQVRNTPFCVVMGVTTSGEREILGSGPATRCIRSRSCGVPFLAGREGYCQFLDLIFKGALHQLGQEHIQLPADAVVRVHGRDRVCLF
ncbi:transposase [Arthrobacter nitrophenolicus]